MNILSTFLDGKNVLRGYLLTLALLALTATAPLLAEDSRIQAQLDEPIPTTPLLNVLGDEKYNELMASGKYRYVGNLKCRLCHREFFLGRKKDAHDYAFNLLKNTDHQDNPRCLVCHVTGYKVDTGFTTISESLRLTHVQCEGCHGPGNIHIKKRAKGGLPVGTDRPDILKKMCQSCHTERWSRSYDDLDAAYKKYRHALPE